MSPLSLDPSDLIAIWPAAITAALVIVRGRRREGSRRERLNEALHELRRPLQVIALGRRAPAGDRLDPVELALHALRDLDREINGGDRRLTKRTIEARELVDSAAVRWRGRAARSSRPLRVRWLCGPALVEGDPLRLSQALDNLIANALQHGHGPVTLIATEAGDAIRISVRDGGPARPPLRPRGTDPRRGHGLRLAGRVAAGHGGSLELRRTGAGTVAALRLPVARAAPAR